MSNVIPILISCAALVFSVYVFINNINRIAATYCLRCMRFWPAANTNEGDIFCSKRLSMSRPLKRFAMKNIAISTVP